MESRTSLTVALVSGLKPSATFTTCNILWDSGRRQADTCSDSDIDRTRSNLLRFSHFEHQEMKSRSDELAWSFSKLVTFTFPVDDDGGCGFRFANGV